MHWSYPTTLLPPSPPAPFLIPSNYYCLILVSPVAICHFRLDFHDDKWLSLAICHPSIFLSEVHPHFHLLFCWGFVFIALNYKSSLHIDESFVKHALHRCPSSLSFDYCFFVKINFNILIKSNLFMFFFLGTTGVWNQCLKCSTTWAIPSPRPFCFSVFFRQGLVLLPKASFGLPFSYLLVPHS
jgi:hypothetical protein